MKVVWLPFVCVLFLLEHYGFSKADVVHENANASAWEWKIHGLVWVVSELKTRQLAIFRSQKTGIYDLSIAMFALNRNHTSVCIVEDTENQSQTAILQEDLLKSGTSTFVAFDGAIRDFDKWNKIIYASCGRVYWIIVEDDEFATSFYNETGLKDCRSLSWTLLVPTKRAASRPYAVYHPTYPTLSSPRVVLKRLKKIFPRTGSSKHPSLSNLTFRLAVNNYEPYITINSKNDDLQFSDLTGVDANIMQMLKQKYKFGLKVLTSTDGQWGSLDSVTGKWSGLVGMLHNKEADIAMSSFAASYSRSRVVDFSIVYTDEGQVLFVKAPKIKSKVYVAVKPFTSGLWILNTIALVFAIYLVYFLAKKKAAMMEWRKISLNRTTWFFISTLINQGCRMTYFKGRPALVFLGVWLWYVLIIRTCYSGVLMSFMTFPGRERVIRDFFDLAEAMRTRRYKCGTIKGTTQQNTLMGLGGPLSIIPRKIQEDASVIVSTSQEGFQKVIEEDYAFFVLKSIGIFQARAMGIEKLLFYGDELGGELATAIYAKNFPYKKQMNFVIRRLFETGIIEKWKTHEMNRHSFLASNSNDSTAEADESETERPLTFHDLKGLWLLLGYGYALAVLGLAGEILWFKFRNRKRPTPRRKKKGTAVSVWVSRH